MTNESVQVVNKPAFLEVSDGEVLIPITTNTSIKISLIWPVLQRLLLWNIYLRLPTTHFQHQIDLLRQELEKDVLRIIILKNKTKKKKKKKSPDGRAHKTDEAEILYEKIRMLEKENQCLKNKIKNQQVVIEMLITNDKCAD